MSEFIYQEPFPIECDKTQYRLLTKEYVKIVECDGRRILKVDPKGIELLAREAYTDVSFYLRPAHLEQLRHILEDPEASDNDKFVAYTMLLNQTVAAEGELPTCQDTGTAICIGKKGENVFTGADDAECIARGAYEAYKERNLRYSQVVPFTMTEEKNSGTNLPAQIDLYADKGNEYKFLFITKGGGSANKTFLYQQTKALLNEKSLLEFFRSKLMDLGTSACPPYHLAVCIGGTSAEMCLATVKKASAGYLDQLPTSGNEGGRCFRDLGVGTENPPDLPGERYRRPVRRQIPRTRRAGDPRSAPRGVVPRRHRRKLLGRPQHQSQNYRRGHLPRTAREEPGPLPAQRGPPPCRPPWTSTWIKAWTRCAKSSPNIRSKRA